MFCAMLHQPARKLLPQRTQPAGDEIRAVARNDQWGGRGFARRVQTESVSLSGADCNLIFTLRYCDLFCNPVGNFAILSGFDVDQAAPNFGMFEGNRSSQSPKQGLACS